MPFLTLSSTVSQLNRVGKTVAARLRFLEIETIEDLLYHFPFRYEDWSRISRIRDLEPETAASVRATLVSIAHRQGFRMVKSITEACVSDGDSEIPVIWFNQPYLAETLKTGEEFFLSGKVGLGRGGRVLLNPEYEKIKDRNVEPIHTTGVVPIYPVTANVSQKQIRFLMKQALSQVTELPSDWLPDSTKQQYSLVDLAKAIQDIHFPESLPDAMLAKRRLKFDELFLLQLQNACLKQDILRYDTFPQDIHSEQLHTFVETLPFHLTDAQRKCAWTILQDLSKDRPMNRLLQGDVGSGKTVVAAIAVYNALLNGYQVAFMSPTEILNQQHFESLARYFASTPFGLALLTRHHAITFAHNERKEENRKSELLEQIADGRISLVIGTHSLLADEVVFQRLGLVIVDEQHRFGVEQRKKLREKMSKHKNDGKEVFPHLLSMTATPIPRTLALTLYGDLSISVMNEMPLGRKKVMTRIVRKNDREGVYRFIAREIDSGRQCFVICPLIEESDILGITSVKEEAEILKKVFPQMNIVVLHSRVKPAEKEAIMEAFKGKKAHILIATTMVEVGVDVPNATIMMIEGGERFGLAQLHQLRGRVGRGEHQSYCFVFTHGGSPLTYQRMKVFETCYSGFELANKDLELRGPGEFFGRQQSGLPEFKIATLADSELIAQANDAAQRILSNGELEQSFELKRKVESKLAEVHLE
jgi:ATP-dependent DNA helicase RecG